MLIPGIRPGHMSVLAPTHSPNGPWLPRGLYCPPGFSLTMAISEPLHASRQFNVYVRLALRSCASLQRVPNLLCQSFCCVPSSVLRWPQQVLLTMSSLPVLSSPNSKGLDSHTLPSAIQIHRGCPLEAAMFASRYGPHASLALLWSGLLLPSFRRPGRPSAYVGYD